MLWASVRLVFLDTELFKKLNQYTSSPSEIKYPDWLYILVFAFFIIFNIYISLFLRSCEGWIDIRGFRSRIDSNPSTLLNFSVEFIESIESIGIMEVIQIEVDQAHTYVIGEVVSHNRKGQII